MAWNWSGAGGGAMSGAAMGSSFGPWGTVIGGVGGAVLGGISGDEKKQIDQKPDVPQWQLDAAKKYSGWLSGNLDKYEPGKDFTGQRVAGMSSPEQQSMGWLQKYLDQPGTGSNFQLSQDELKKTMTGEYDPYKSEYYKDMRTGMNTEMEEQIDVMRRGQGARGTYFQDTSMREENKMRSKGMNSLMQILGGMAETERGRRFQGIEKGVALDEYAQGAPLKKAAAGQELGSLSRIIEQADLESTYQDFLRKQEELGKIPGLMAGQTGQRYSYGYGGPLESTAPSSFERIMGLAGNLQGSGAMDKIAGSLKSFGNNAKTVNMGSGSYSTGVIRPGQTSLIT